MSTTYGSGRDSSQLLNDGFVQQEVKYTNVQDTFIVIPAFSYIVADNDFRKGIAGKGKGLIFRFCFFLRAEGVGGLYIGFFPPEAAMKSISLATGVSLPFEFRSLL